MVYYLSHFLLWSTLPFSTPFQAGRVIIVNSITWASLLEGLFGVTIRRHQKVEEEERLVPSPCLTAMTRLMGCRNTLPCWSLSPWRYHLVLLYLLRCSLSSRSYPGISLSTTAVSGQLFPAEVLILKVILTVCGIREKLLFTNFKSFTHKSCLSTSFLLKKLQWI